MGVERMASTALLEVLQASPLQRLETLNHRDPKGGKGEGGRGLYFLK